MHPTAPPKPVEIYKSATKSCVPKFLSFLD
jgi:hypothetical protein